VRIGRNKIDDSGMELNIEDKVNANIKFGRLSPIKYDAMGPFRFLPFMECRHKVTSMHHTVIGHITIGEQTRNFKDDKGYIEGDAGHSFPQKYFWTQCNSFGENLSIMMSAAIIPYLKFKFMGTICIVHIDGKEYRLATYLGARVKLLTRDKLVISQGRGKNRMTLEAGLLDGRGIHDLFAPEHGTMERVIRESISSSVHYKFTKGNQVLIDITSDKAAYEYSEV
jgi:hypothetical protein